MIFPRFNNEINPLVSVVICTYNRENYIQQTINSVLSQERDFKIEIIIGDDASTDGTRSVLLEYQKKHPEVITLLFQDENQGIAKNWASLMKLVSGKYVALCDDDDYWHNNQKLQMQVDILEKNEDIGLVYTNYRSINVKTNVIKEYKIKNKSQKKLLNALFDGEYLMMTSSVVFRNLLIQRYVNLDDYIKYNFPIQDWVTWILIAKFTNFYHLNISALTYCISTDSLSRSLDFDKVVSKYEKEHIMYKYICDKFPQDLIYNEDRWNDYVNNIYLIFAYNAGDYTLAKLYGKKLKNNRIKVLCSKNKLFFNTYLGLKYLYHKSEKF